MYNYVRFGINKLQRIPKGQSKIENPEKLVTQGTQDEDKQNNGGLLIYFSSMNACM